MIDKHIRIEEAMNERIRESGLSLVELIERGLKGKEEQEEDTGLPQWLFSLEDAEQKDIYAYLKRLEDNDFNGRLIEEIYDQGLETRHREVLMKIADKNSVYYVPLVEKYIGSLVKAENRLEALEVEIDAKTSEYNQLENDYDKLVKKESELREEIEDMEIPVEDYNTDEGIYRAFLIESSTEMEEIRKARESKLTPIVEQYVLDHMNSLIVHKYTLETSLIGDDIWRYVSPYENLSDEERAHDFERVALFFRAMRMEHVTIANFIKVAEEVRDKYPELNV